MSEWMEGYLVGVISMTVASIAVHFFSVWRSKKVEDNHEQ